MIHTTETSGGVATPAPPETGTIRGVPDGEGAATVRPPATDRELIAAVPDGGER